MNQKWLSYGGMALLLLAGCGKSNNTTNQPNQGDNSANQSAQQQAGSSGSSSAPAQPSPIVVPAGTSIPVVLTTSLSSYSNKSGDEFEGSVAAPVIVDGQEAIRKGAEVKGTVVDAKKQGAIKGQAILSITLTSIRVAGRTHSIETSTYEAAEKGKGKRSAEITGGGAALGALIGGLAGGGKGAAIGAGVGAGGGLAASAKTGGHNVELPSETRLTFKLTQSLTINR
jgi:hypothetical protein